MNDQSRYDAVSSTGQKKYTAKAIQSESVLKQVGQQIRIMSHSLEGLVCEGMANLHQVVVSEQQVAWNQIYLYGEHQVTAVLNALGRKGPIKLVLERPYDIKVYVAERQQDLAAETATWILKSQPI